MSQRMILCVVSLSILLIPTVFSQNLLEERIWKLSGRKRSIFLERGIFHSGQKGLATTLRKVRHRFDKRKMQERIVLDVDHEQLPYIYGHLAHGEKKLYVDFFKTTLSDGVGSFGQSHYVKNLNFYPLDAEISTLEFEFKEKVSLDIFYLEKPGRLVIDIKK